MSDWQPIETAPKDGTPLCLVEDGSYTGLTIPHQAVGFWKPDKRFVAGGFWALLDDACFQVHPTHWMPLPDPSKEVSR